MWLMYYMGGNPLNLKWMEYSGPFDIYRDLVPYQVDTLENIHIGFVGLVASLSTKAIYSQIWCMSGHNQKYVTGRQFRSW